MAELAFWVKWTKIQFNQSLKCYLSENYQTICNFKSKSMSFDVTSGPKITSGIWKILKAMTIAFLTLSDLKRHWLTLTDLFLE